MTDAMADTPNPYVSRGGLKLAAALDEFGVDVANFTCADLGCNVGGFTDCLLQRGAARVYAVDTGYGALAWKLRNDHRVIVLERRNALHIDLALIDPKPSEVDLVVIDLGWTRQSHAIPAALRWNPRQIITLIKPHYEADERGILPDELAAQVAGRLIEQMPTMGVRVVRHMRSPVRGGAGKGKAGNIEYLALLKPE